ncbi:FitA-like ribbon-helix-helix domain-containing protein [Jiella sonneratiae]|uniref:Antitoxin FitA-like ribbon-helix-helix domain-containing protein n=1 Tax=Jiella sonneratiae TaxID=2816856 RepID=A0ABS3J9N4_9HYPH|nr:hypothetical protein [Jiella sonneratiae]MBO0906365.1 hypothetical protein [Jiella sonneratiae]
MGEIIVRQLDDDLIEAVERSAVANNRSLEAELRALIEQRYRPKLPTRLDDDGRSILDYVGIAPSNRTTEEIVAEIRALRDEWDD